MEFISDIAELSAFPGFGVDRYGNVYILDTPSGVPYVLPQKKESGGYRYVTICMRGCRYEPEVHYLVAEAFIPNPYGYLYVNHLDKNHSNNRVENLYWSEVTEVRQHIPGEKSLPLPCKIRNSLTNEIMHFDSELSAAEFLGVSQGAVSSALSKDNPHRVRGYDAALEDEEFIFRPEKELTVSATNIVTGETLWFPSAYMMAKELGFDQSNLSKALNGERRNLIKGWKVEYVEANGGKRISCSYIDEM